MKKLLAVGIILLLVCVSIPSTGRVMDKSNPLSVEGNTLYVGGSGPGNYTKIQDAIDNASDGDTVFVYSGTYYGKGTPQYDESLILVNKSINMVGENKTTTIIDGGTYRLFRGIVLIDNADWVNFSGFTVKSGGNGGKGLAVYSNHSNIFNNNIIHYNYSDCALLSVGYDCNNINGNNITYIGSGYGGTIYWTADNSNFSNNIVSNLRYFGTSGYTIYLYDNIFSNCSEVIWCEVGWMKNCVISGNVFSNIDRNVFWIRGLRESKIVNNRFINNDGFCFCILAKNSYKNIISNNVFQNNYACMFITPGMFNIISGNSFIENEYAVVLWQANLNLFYHNNFIDNGVNVECQILSIYNKWKGNYWDKPRDYPYPIVGRIGLFLPSWINWDLFPAQEPYDIGV